MLRALIAVLLAFLVAAIPILLAGKSPLTAYGALMRGAFGSLDHVAFALNKSTPYILIAVGIGLCFRAGIINIGGEGQVAMGALAASWIALNLGGSPLLTILLSLAGGAAMGGLWAGLAAAIRLTRGVHEVLSTLLLNFVGVLVVSAALNGPMGESGSGFPQSPLFRAGVLLPKLFPGSELHAGFLIALVVAVLAQVLLWRTRFGFQLRMLGGSRSAADYAGVSFAAGVMGVMLLSGSLAGLAGAVEVLGVHYRLIEGFSQGFGFTAVAVALLGAADPLAAIPAALFFGFLDAGALAMQREVGIPSSLVFVVQGLSIILALCAMGLDRQRRRI
jgi:simple sugar transport system permease protein